MGYYSKHTDRMDIHIEEDRGTILIKQKWRYFWLNSLGTSSWTYSEKRKFHNKIEDLIWNHWGDHFFLKVKGTSDFAKKNVKKRWDVNFDIEWVLHTEHWKVKVKKYPADYTGTPPTSRVRWNSREVILDTLDTQHRYRDKNGKRYFQYPIVHEFGHTIGNTAVLNRGDEYRTSSAHYSDRKSIMNVGHRLKERHLMVHH